MGASCPAPQMLHCIVLMWAENQSLSGTGNREVKRNFTLNAAQTGSTCLNLSFHWLLLLFSDCSFSWELMHLQERLFISKIVFCLSWEVIHKMTQSASEIFIKLWSPQLWTQFSPVILESLKYIWYLGVNSLYSTNKNSNTSYCTNKNSFSVLPHSCFVRELRFTIEIVVEDWEILIFISSFNRLWSETLSACVILLNLSFLVLFHN